MTSLSIPRPEPAEAAAAFHGYIAAVSGEDIGDRLNAQLVEIERLLAPLNETAALARYAPGKWSVKEVLGHLIDAERIFSYRLLRVARGDATPLPGFDENAYVPAARFDERPLSSLREEFRAVRRSTIALVHGLRPECWTHWGRASDNPVTARALAYIIVGHVAHHLRVLQERYGLAPAAPQHAGR